MPHRTLILPSGVSRPGAAISADIYPEIDMPLAVGTVVGRVVRHLDVGFAVKFTSLQDMESLEANLTRQLADMAQGQAAQGAKSASAA